MILIFKILLMHSSEFPFKFLIWHFVFMESLPLLCGALLLATRVGRLRSVPCRAPCPAEIGAGVGGSGGRCTCSLLAAPSAC